MVARAYTVAFEGVEARLVEVQCAVSAGLPGFTLVGLPDKAVSEAKERVRAALSGDVHRAAVQADHRQPLARRPAQGRLAFRPAHRAGPAGRAGHHPADEVERTVALGELSLDGRLIAGDRRAARRDGRRRGGPHPALPRACGAEAAWVGATQVLAAASLAEVVRHFTGQAPLHPGRGGRGRRPPLAAAICAT